ncbi:hypothetical protein [Paenibacillus sp. AK121]|uniref:hypothetical protein n=1 Tax=Paenibacillus sp. AK121 TaxID=2849670 RepID=UPI0020B386F0|nr:hypothetical protein [Paenibacillus sp. AK121]
MMKLASKWTVLTLMMMLITTAGATAQGYTPVAAAENQETVYKPNGHSRWTNLFVSRSD